MYKSGIGGSWPRSFFLLGVASRSLMTPQPAFAKAPWLRRSLGPASSCSAAGAAAARAAIRHSSSSTRRCATTLVREHVGPVRYYLVLRRGSGMAVLCSLLAMALPSDEEAAQCAAGAKRGSGRRGPEKEEDEDDAEMALRKALDAALGPMGGEITFGCLVGFTSGYALKKVGKAAAFCIGVAYVAASTLQALGYVDVNWTRLEQQVMRLLGKEEGDFSLTQADAAYYVGKLKEALTYQLPSTAGFASGFAVGLYKG